MNFKKISEQSDFFKSQATVKSWLRGSLRRIWTKWPPRMSFLRKSRVRACIGRNGREVWAVKCEVCDTTLPQSMAQVDHIEPAGTFDEDNIGQFIDRLLCEESNMRIVCKRCHGVITLAERLNITIREAEIEKLAIEFSKKLVSNQKRTLLMMGADENSATNAKQRRALFTKLLTTNQNP